MKLTDIVLLSLAAAFTIIGVHQLIVITNNESFTVGFTHSYWIFMLSISLFLFYQLRKKKAQAAEKAAQTPGRPSRNPKPVRKPGKTR
jgi:amino acid permease